MLQEGRAQSEVLRRIGLVDAGRDGVCELQSQPRIPLCLQETDAVTACDGIIDLLAIFFNVSGRQLRSPKRTSPPIARVRQIGMYIAHVSLGLKMAWVGSGFRRDRSTVMHACHIIEDLRDDEDFDHIVARVDMLVRTAFSLSEGGRA